MVNAREVFAGVEGGGSKFVCAIGTGPDDVIDRARVPTTTPDATLGAVAEFIARPRTGVRVTAVGVACFGPLELRTTAEGYGRITTTPKPGWQNADVLGRLRRAIGLPVALDTDVNGAALAEWQWGAGRAVAAEAPPAALAYVTVGTGVGGGLVIDGRTWRGTRAHPEMGHVRVPALAGDAFVGTCPFHGRCLEGLVSAPALRARTGRDPASLAPDDPAMVLSARYLACGLLAITAVAAPSRIVLGGGVGRAPGMLALVRAALVELDGGYTAALADDDAAARYVVSPSLGDDAGVLGALALARVAPPA